MGFDLIARSRLSLRDRQTRDKLPFIGAKVLQSLGKLCHSMVIGITIGQDSPHPSVNQVSNIYPPEGGTFEFKFDSSV